MVPGRRNDISTHFQDAGHVAVVSTLGQGAKRTTSHFWKWLSCRIGPASLPWQHKASGAHVWNEVTMSLAPGPLSSAPAVQPILCNHYLMIPGFCLERIEGFDLQEASLQGRGMSIFGMWIMSVRGRQAPL